MVDVEEGGVLLEALEGVAAGGGVEQLVEVAEARARELLLVLRAQRAPRAGPGTAAARRVRRGGVVGGGGGGLELAQQQRGAFLQLLLLLGRPEPSSARGPSALRGHPGAG